MSVATLPSVTLPSRLADITVLALLLGVLTLAAVRDARVDCRDVDRYLRDSAGSRGRDV
jgi:hypothetical protein